MPRGIETCHTLLFIKKVMTNIAVKCQIKGKIMMNLFDQSLFVA